jgi:shikimate dehydrogenase
MAAIAKPVAPMGRSYMNRYAVLGQPIAHSLSPQIHQAFAAQAGERLSYERIEVAPEALAERLAALHAQHYLGLNVTQPHKPAVLAAAVQSTERAQRAGAANTLTRLAEGWRADTTDGEGLVRDLRDNLGWTLSGKAVLLLGSGGAARSVIEALLGEKPAALVVSGRTPWNVEKIAAEFKALGPVQPCTHLALKGSRFDLVINATSAGLSGQAPRIAPGIFAPGAACYDMGYGAAHAPVQAWARGQGVSRIADGLGMLVEQAAAAYALWRGRRPRTAPVIEELRRS